MPTNARHYLFDTSAALALVDTGNPNRGWLLQFTNGSRRGLSGHAFFELYSVLTRLPQSAGRLSAAGAKALIERDFPESRFLAPADQAALLTQLAAEGISGGSVYDALVGAAARAHGLPLISCDLRARVVYRALGVDLVSQTSS
ncbi:MAG: type II toxin-antitoxin system VapC family toxin [Bifidobacteriaceae bacterium]|nr:type II toxin-antitoxin system VapC family toxin [Bifidobacteriaceae bacterium]